MYEIFIKRLLDVILSLLGFILLSPLFIIFTILLTVLNNGVPFFYQLRPGKSERIFKIIKFKTMTGERDENNKLLPDKKRITKIGRFIRKTSLDEIPQLLNVIKGDMSLVGPRPLLPDYLPLYNDTQKKRHNVKPGITGWAQVNGRNTINWQQKFEFDVWYANNISFCLDLKIVFLTFKKVLISEGISADGSVSVGRFKGN